MRIVNTYSKIRWDNPAEWDKNVVNEVMETVSEDVANDILKQRQRIRGDWSIAFPAFTRKQRDIIRKVLGPDVIFMVLNLTNDCIKKRLAARHGSDGEVAERLNKNLLEFYKFFETAGEDEDNAFNIMIEEDMTVDNVTDKIMDIIKSV